MFSEQRLTTPSSGRPQGRFAPFGPPLMSNVRHPETMELHYPSASTITLLALIPLLAWRIYARFKRMVGRQRLSKVRPRITLAIFPTLVLLLGAATLSHPERLWLLAVGLGAGALLGVYGLSRTKLEPTAPRALLHAQRPPWHCALPALRGPHRLPLRGGPRARATGSSQDG